MVTQMISEETKVTQMDWVETRVTQMVWVDTRAQVVCEETRVIYLGSLG